MELNRGIILLVSLFLITNFLGLMAAQNLQQVEEIQETAEQNQSAASGLYIFLLIGISTVLLLALYKINAQLVIKAWFGLAMFVSTLIFFQSFFTPFAALVITAIIIAARFLVDDPGVMNALTIFAFAGFGAFFGSILGFEAIIALMVVLSIYDYFSVNISKHMVALAKFGMQTNTFMGFTYPKEEGGMQQGDVDDIEDLEPVEDSDESSRTAASQGEAAKKRGMGVLGGGDIVIPLAFAAALLPDFGILPAAVSILGAATGLTFLLMKAQEGKFYPAVPPVAFGSIVGFGMTYAILQFVLPMV